MYFRTSHYESNILFKYQVLPQLLLTFILILCFRPEQIAIISNKNINIALKCFDILSRREQKE